MQGPGARRAWCSREHGAEQRLPQTQAGGGEGAPSGEAQPGPALGPVRMGGACPAPRSSDPGPTPPTAARTRLSAAVNTAAQRLRDIESNPDDSFPEKVLLFISIVQTAWSDQPR